MSSGPLLINDVTGLNPIPVLGVIRPSSVSDVVAVLAKTDVPISVGGGHFSMGGQTASPGSLHIDMRSLNRVLQFSPQDRSIRVQAGIRSCDIQKFIDPHGLAVKIMQTYANFTVGGSLSVNVHGRYVGLGPLVLSAQSIRVALIGGDVVDASPKLNSELFYACIGGYGALGVIVEAELSLDENRRVERNTAKMPLARYSRFFRDTVRNNPNVVFHNADIYARDFVRVRAQTWTETSRPPTTRTRLQWHRRKHLLEKYFLWAITETPFGKWRREYLIDPILFAGKPVHWRNYEAGYNVAELEPVQRATSTYVLQEYFVPVDALEACVAAVSEILRRHRVNVINISIRHAHSDPGTLLSWTRGETFALVLYYKQRTRDNARDRVGVWTRELISAVLRAGGSYYLPYQLHATAEQFHQAYPRAQELFALKQRLDPDYRLRNALLDKYYAPTVDLHVAHPMRIGAAAGARCLQRPSLRLQSSTRCFLTLCGTTGFIHFCKTCSDCTPKIASCCCSRRPASDIQPMKTSIGMYSNGCPASSLLWETCDSPCQRCVSRSWKCTAKPWSYSVHGRQLTATWRSAAPGGTSALYEKA
jgi:FAD/FMN-containing dehydrogenase